MYRVAFTSLSGKKDYFIKNTWESALTSVSNLTEKGGLAEVTHVGTGSLVLSIYRAGDFI